MWRVQPRKRPNVKACKGEKVQTLRHPSTRRSRCQTGTFSRSLLALAALAAGGRPVAADGPSDVTCLKLCATATVYDQTPRLADVLTLVSGDARLLEQVGHEPVVPRGGSGVPAAEHQSICVVTHDQIVRRLDELGVNLARVLVSGSLSCRISFASPGHAGDVALAADQGAPVRLPDRQAADGGGARTLADILRAHADGELKELGGTAELKFERAGQEFLQLTSPPWEFSVSSTGREKLGLREFRVVIRRDGQVQRKVQVFAEVRLVRPVVVARRPLNPGNTVRPDDVTVETRVFDSELAAAGPGRRAAGATPLPTQLGEVVGQQVKRFVAAGEMVVPDALKLGDLVARSRPVTVIGDGPNVQVRLAGVALDSGGYGDTVRVRLGDVRGEKRVLTGVVAGLGTVRLTEGHP